MKQLTRFHWWSAPMTLVILLLLASCSSKTDFASETSDSTTISEDTVAGDDYASAELEDAWENGALGDGRPPQDGVWVYQAIWMSKAFDDELNLALNIDSAMKADPLPIAYFDFTSEDAYLGLFDFTTYLANGGPAEQLVFNSLDAMESENIATAGIQTGDTNPRGITRIEMTRKNDYDDDGDGVVDDLETVDIIFLKGDIIVDSRSYFKTYRAPDEIAHSALLTGTYEDAEGGVYTLDRSGSRPPDRYKLCSNYLATQECWSYTQFRLTTPETTFDYVLQADEAGNDYLMMGEDAGFAYSRKGDSLTIYAREGLYQLVKK